MGQIVRRAILASLIPLGILLGALAASAVELPPAAVASAADHSVASDVTTLPTAGAWQPGDPVREVPLRRPSRRVPPAPPQAQFDVRSLIPPSGPPVLDRLKAIAGQSFAGAFPPDTVGAVGREYFIQVVNSFTFDGEGARVTIYSKSGVLLAGPFTLSSLWPNPTDSCADGFGDGVAVYEARADRFVILQLPFFENFLCVYVAKTSNPVRGGFHAYQFQTPEFPDYPKIAVWCGSYVVTSNEFNPAVYALERAPMLQGDSPASSASKLTRCPACSSRRSPRRP
jgi:hypothetical protein